MRHLILIGALVCVSCGGSDSPRTSTAPTPVTLQVGGVWALSSQITGVTGGECFATAFQSLVGARGTGTAQIQQSGATLTATVTDDDTGGSCAYTGTAGTTTIALNASSCTASDVLGASCPNGAIRNLRLVTAAFNGTGTAAALSGTAAETYNITTASGAGVGTATINYSFTASRR